MTANPMPAAQVDVTADLVTRLLAEQHPDLAGLPVRFLANGWDNVMFRVGDELLARLPRRELGAAVIAHEQRWLPLLAPRLPIQIPYPERTGVPARGYPWPWSIVPYLPGKPAADLDDFDRARAATAVGEFLGALHAPAPPDAPANPFRGVPLLDRAESFAANLGSLAGQVDERAARRVWLDAITAPRHAGPPAWLHGDLHPANILIHDRRVSGVIDFGDITSGDPAADLAAAWMLLPASLHGAFREAYQATVSRATVSRATVSRATVSRATVSRATGGPDRGPASEALWTRAKGWALNFALIFLAHSSDNPQLRGVGHRTLHTVLAAPTCPA